MDWRSNDKIHFYGWGQGLISADFTIKTVGHGRRRVKSERTAALKYSSSEERADRGCGEARPQQVQSCRKVERT